MKKQLFFFIALIGILKAQAEVSSVQYAKWHVPDSETATTNLYQSVQNNIYSLASQTDLIIALNNKLYNTGIHTIRANSSIESGICNIQTDLQMGIVDDDLTAQVKKLLYWKEGVLGSKKNDSRLFQINDDSGEYIEDDVVFEKYNDNSQDVSGYLYAKGYGNNGVFNFFTLDEKLKTAQVNQQTTDENISLAGGRVKGLLKDRIENQLYRSLQAQSQGLYFPKKEYMEKKQAIDLCLSNNEVDSCLTTIFDEISSISSLMSATFYEGYQGDIVDIGAAIYTGGQNEQ